MSFLFAIVQPGAQAWAKADLARARPELRPAYSRPGLLTWKSEREIDPAAPIETPFARVWGRGIGALGSPGEIVEAARAAGGPLRLHVLARDARDRDAPDERDLARARDVEAALRAEGPFLEGAIAEDGDRVLDVIVGGDDPLYVGLHVHGPGRIAEPGGRFASIVVPEESPSRAYRKVEEMIAWARLPVRAGDVALEIGAAPGGAAYALARRGVQVIAVDPAAVDPRVLAYRGPGGARVTHLAMAAGAVRPEDLPAGGARWILSDVNLAPPVMLRSVERLAALLDRRARGGNRGWEGMILTMKINDAAIAADLPRLVARARALGGGDPHAEVRAIQLPAHRREIGVIVLRGSGAAPRSPASPSEPRAGAGDRGARGPRGGARGRAPRTR